MKTILLRRLAWGWGGLYLTLAVLGAWSSVPYTQSGRFNDVLYGIMDITGTNNDFGFFAPAVSSQVRANVLLRKAQGQPEYYNFWSANKEINFRLNSLITTSMRRPLLRDVCARSWAAALLGSRPDAEQVTLIGYVHDLPSMHRFSTGLRPTWRPFYESTFERVSPAHPSLLP